MEGTPRNADAGQLEIECLPTADWDEELDQMFQDFIESISLSREELAALVAMPEASVSDVRQMFAARRLPSERRTAKPWSRSCTDRCLS